MDQIEMSEQRAAIRAVLENPRFELIPLKNVLDQARFLPAGAAVSVTASPQKTLEDTLDLVGALTDRGFRAVPHLSARMTVDRAHLESLLGRVEALEIDEVFVIGGDAEPRGEFFDAGSLLDAMDDIGHDLTVGIGAYPEGHHLFDGETALAALHAKQPFADHLVTQMCFDGEAITSWLSNIRAEGIHLPAVLGLPGVGDRLKLIKIAARIGVGPSVRFVAQHRGLLRSFVSPARYSADELLEDLAGTLVDPTANVTGVHIYTFNQVEATERWRLEYLESL